MIDDLEHYDRIELETFRLFSWAPGQRFPDRRFHFAPVPTSIGEERWVMTTIRIQHLATVSEDRQWARWMKYAEADPERRWQTDYTYALVPPGEIRPWRARPPDLPVIRGEHVVAPWDVDVLDLEGPVLSVIVTVTPTEPDASPFVEALVKDGTDLPVEVLLVDRAETGSGERIRAQLPSVLVLAASRLSPNEAADLALRTARGDYVLSLSTGDRVDPGTLKRIVDAHENGHELVTGTTNPGPTRASVPREATLALGTGRRPEPAQRTVAQELFARGLSSTSVEGLTFVRDPLEHST
jgi:hypothetical protein